MIYLRTFMKNSLTSACRHCRHYTPEGRRGGVCNLLSVPVESQWEACSLAVSPFGHLGENLEDIEMWQEVTVTLQDVAVTLADRNDYQLTGTTLIEKWHSSLGIVTPQQERAYHFRFSIFDRGITDEYQGLDLAKQFYCFWKLVSILTLWDDRVHWTLPTHKS